MALCDKFIDILQGWSFDEEDGCMDNGWNLHHEETCGFTVLALDVPSSESEVSDCRKRKQSESIGSLTSQETQSQSLLPSLKKKKRKQQHLACPSRPIYSAAHYGKSVIDAMNSFDSDCLLKELLVLCAPEVQILKTVYSVEDSYLTTSEFPSLQSFCQYLDAWKIFIPDGIFTSSRHRIIVDRFPTLGFMSCLTFTGKRIAKEVHVLFAPLEHYPPSYHEAVAGLEMWRHGMIGRHCDLETYSLTGSLAQEGLYYASGVFLTESTCE